MKTGRTIPRLGLLQYKWHVNEDCSIRSSSTAPHVIQGQIIIDGYLIDVCK